MHRISSISLEEFSPETVSGRWLEAGPGRRHLTGHKTLYKSRSGKHILVETAVDFVKNIKHLQVTLICYILGFVIKGRE